MMSVVKGKWPIRKKNESDPAEISPRLFPSRVEQSAKVQRGIALSISFIDRMCFRATVFVCICIKLKKQVFVPVCSPRHINIDSFLRETGLAKTTVRSKHNLGTVACFYILFSL